MPGLSCGKHLPTTLDRHCVQPRNKGRSASGEQQKKTLKQTLQFAKDYHCHYTCNCDCHRQCHHHLSLSITNPTGRLVPRTRPGTLPQTAGGSPGGASRIRTRVLLSAHPAPLMKTRSQSPACASEADILENDGQTEMLRVDNGVHKCLLPTMVLWAIAPFSSFIIEWLQLCMPSQQVTPPYQCWNLIWHGHTQDADAKWKKRCCILATVDQHPNSLILCCQKKKRPWGGSLHRLDSLVKKPHTDPFQTPSKLGQPSYPSSRRLRTTFPSHQMP